MNSEALNRRAIVANMLDGPNGIWALDKLIGPLILGKGPY